MGFVFMPVTVLALSGVANRESGAASGLLNVMQMVGGSIGLAVLTTVFGTALRNETEKELPAILANSTPEQIVQFQQTKIAPPPFYDLILAHGIARAFQFAALLAVAALLVTIFAIKAKPSDVDVSAIQGAGVAE
jgi:hypothetical protein